MIRIHNANPDRIHNLRIIPQESGNLLTYESPSTAVYGMGERYDSINRLNRKTVIRVRQKFTHQGEQTYFPLPFYLSDNGHGLYVRTDREVIFDLTPQEFRVEISDPDCDVFFFYGSPKEIVSAFIEMTGKAFLPPEWAFGPWVSANRWNKQSDIEEQREMIRKYHYPATVLVIEAWSDEATFYIWNGARAPLKNGEDSFSMTDFRFSEPWPDPQGMIDALHAQGIRLLLWQIPALKKLDEGQISPQHDADVAFALANHLVAWHADIERTPYQIPEEWFIGSYLPDFTNPKTREWWMAKRKYLTDMGVDGFKTDGGEFVYDPTIQFSNGKSGESMANRYCVEYEETYHHAIGNERVLFSRAGYTGAQAVSLHWAGDQCSTFDELKAVLNAGISLGLSGIPFWGFDIGGFAGPMPSAELYLRATALAVFSPIMQWHSEPMGGQYGGMAERDHINDRSPWNMEKQSGDPNVCTTAVFFANLRMNLLPELYNQAWKASEKNQPMMRHLIFDYPTDQAAVNCEDEFMLGDLLVAPIVEEGVIQRGVYLPEGGWYDFWSGKRYEGQSMIEVSAALDRIPVFLREGGAVMLHLPAEGRLGDDVGNQVGNYDHLVLLTGGTAADYSFRDSTGHSFRLSGGQSEGIIPDEITVKNLQDSPMI